MSKYSPLINIKSFLIVTNLSSTRSTPNQIFKVIQTQTRGDKHLVTLLHKPEDCLEYFKSSDSDHFENMLTWQTLTDLEEALTLQLIPKLLSDHWKERVLY